MYLHDDKLKFKAAVEQVAKTNGYNGTVIEKDYYITMILRMMATFNEHCVFKGGTSLSKGFGIIKRFSEDVDIAFDEHLGAAKRKRLKNEIIKQISDELKMPIINWEETQSDRDFNAYLFSYKSVFDFEDEWLPQSVRLETALGSCAFPTVVVPIESMIGSYFRTSKQDDLVKKYSLNSFPMKLQSLERTYIDKVYALCDYYMLGKSKRYSRHLYDVYKLSFLIEINSDFKSLIMEVRNQRLNMKKGICPSAQSNVSISETVRHFCEEDYYRKDYQEITSYFIQDYVPYHDAIDRIQEISKHFDL